MIMTHDFIPFARENHFPVDLGNAPAQPPLLGKCLASVGPCELCVRKCPVFAGRAILPRLGAALPPELSSHQGHIIEPWQKGRSKPHRASHDIRGGEVEENARRDTAALCYQHCADWHKVNQRRVRL